MLKLDVEQLKEAMAAPPTVECGSGRRWAHRAPAENSGLAVYRAVIAKMTPQQEKNIPRTGDFDGHTA